MSFLDSVLSSIETGKPSPIPTTTSSIPSPPVTSSNAKSEARRLSSVPRAVSSERKNVLPLGTKRKAEEPLPRPYRPEPQALAKPTLSRAVTLPTAPKPRPNTTIMPARPAASSAATTTITSQKAPPVSSKLPPKGSYADLMLKAKALQEKAPTQVGMFKHQSAPKEKLSKTERKKRAAEVQAKEKDSKLAKKASAGSSVSSSMKSANTKPVKRREPEELTYKGTGKPTPSAQPEYRGTASLPSQYGDRRPPPRSNKRSRINEYLGTDEEDEGEYADEPDDYYSESSDMEAGLNDMEEEEATALAFARREDEEEWRAELAAKQEKLERRKKLSMLASKRH
ncbi:hypothetical protein P175DRAFT_0488199 [Aspergillus ochraceoroseus IBT 24754]|uniref:SPT2 chromatin protein n=3 Tax=Aspergillus subgen. Nidulantes TaxID=2720870 RepID=A0A0F8XBZ7_9EURO|nr:uncharacterized protein P175DRAFT_0488199 [Aspergillus ochraceoroseus IBT 24754]KKK12386.1 hypothetical protein AOCH_001901 [Aspergillus ochraceoroseus]KKK27060.1 hypothetical protein ARAM_000019 [Aspergillus rambellii]PTU17161.1 hypothetical protein P175DRAFT_0488199 [Aspergillus ochraceoroseus IBT 24754]